ncbi:MAG: hypothetical protein A2176_15915 [Spirochaetes bacterium RBG_13_51_14]|nr:MAG: hypothetical protein A2176_15915 [Spirochaetes bacterium RBG_13_51_14]
MIDNMFAVMKRIHEIKVRFGLNRQRPVGQNENQHARKSYQEYQRSALSDARGSAAPAAGVGAAGIQGKTVDEIKKLADYYASVNRVPASLVRAVIETESNFNPRAVSPRGAMGLMQLMPSVVKERGVRNPFDPNENISAGVGFLKSLLQEYDGDYKKALAAYNAGRKTVDESGGVPDYRETREYVNKVIDAYVKNGN